MFFLLFFLSRFQISMFKCVVFLFESVFGEISMFLPFFWLVSSLYKCLEGMSMFLYTEFVCSYKLWCFLYFVWGWKCSYLTKSIQHVGTKHSVRMVLNTSKFLWMIYIWMFQLVFSSQVVVMAGTITRTWL